MASTPSKNDGFLTIPNEGDKGYDGFMTMVKKATEKQPAAIAYCQQFGLFQSGDAPINANPTVTPPVAAAARATASTGTPPAATGDISDLLKSHQLPPPPSATKKRKTIILSDDDNDDDDSFASSTSYQQLKKEFEQAKAKYRSKRNELKGSRKKAAKQVRKQIVYYPTTKFETLQKAIAFLKKAQDSTIVRNYHITNMMEKVNDGQSHAAWFKGLCALVMFKWYSDDFNKIPSKQARITTEFTDDTIKEIRSVLSGSPLSLGEETINHIINKKIFSWIKNNVEKYQTFGIWYGGNTTDKGLYHAWFPFLSFLGLLPHAS